MASLLRVRRRLLRLGILLLLTIGLSLAVTTPASAAGDPGLDRLIVSNPIAGWGPLPSSLLQSLVSYEDKTVSSVSNQTVATAAEGWQGAESEQRLIVALIAFPKPIPYVTRNAREAVISACTSSTGNPPASSVQAYAMIPGSQEAQCSGTNVDGDVITGTSLSWVKGNVMVFLEGVGLPRAEVQIVALRQNVALPATGVPEQSSNTALIVGIVGAAAVVVILILVVMVLWTRRRRRAQGVLSGQWPVQWTSPPTEPPGVAAGWMPDPSGRHEQRYWSGTAWTEHVHTNGLAGVDPVSQPAPVGDVSQ
jgi:hypothetical protein